MFTNTDNKPVGPRHSAAEPIETTYYSVVVGTDSLQGYRIQVGEAGGYDTLTEAVAAAEDGRQRRLIDWVNRDTGTRCEDYANLSGDDFEGEAENLIIQGATIEFFTDDSGTYQVVDLY